MKTSRHWLILSLFIFFLNPGCANRITKPDTDFVSAQTSVPAEKITEVKTHLLIGEDYRKKNSKWKKEATDAIREINKRFLEEKIPVFLKIVEIDRKTLNESFLKKIYALKGDPVDNLSEYLYLEHFSKKELPLRHIVIAIIQNKHRMRWGTAFYPKFSPHVAVISRPENSECGNERCPLYLASLIMHEVCHLFDARDLYENNNEDFLMHSEMDFDRLPNFLIDDKNRALILEALKTYYNERL